jgi:uncharacterized SAM-binding protein YcdF (DUF218 family)
MLMVAGMLELLKMVGGPGSIGFLACSAAIGLAVTRLGPRWRRIGRGWLLFVFSTYLVLGLPWVAATIEHELPGVEPASTASALPKLDALVVLGGDNAVGRVQETARVYASASPAVVVVSGEEWLVDRVRSLGIPAARLVVDSRSANTREQIAEVRRQRLALQWSDDRVALIASRLQMPRVARLVKRSGLKVILVPSPIDREPPTSAPWSFVPTYVALRVSRDALYEHAALAYYRRRGWIAQ